MRAALRVSTLAPMLAIAACRSVLGIDEPIGFDAGDAAFDCRGWQPRGLDACAFPPAAPIVLAGPTFTLDTTDGAVLTGPGGEVLRSAYHTTPDDGGDTAVLSIESLRISAGTAVHVIGTRPLILLVWDTLAIDGALDASSVRTPARFGAGSSDSAFCKTMTGRDGQDATTQIGAGGGGGGGFAGGGGLAGTGGRTVLAGGGAGGGTASAALRGGCPGGASGAAGAASMAPAATRARGGAGGGALRLIARTAITLGNNGALAANGAGGAGAPAMSGCGGGGGGAGGYLSLQAPRVQLAGDVTANGGGGGGGGGGSDEGRDGQDGASPALGGPASSSNCGRPGGNGSGPSLGGGPGDSFDPGDCATSGGGGGGGGGAGYIVVDSADFTATGTLSPPVTRP